MRRPRIEKSAQFRGLVMSAGTPPLSGPPKPQAKGLNCPKCGAAIVLRSFGQAETVVCASCHLILDAKDPNLAILQQFEAITRDVKPQTTVSAWPRSEEHTSELQ